MMGHEIQSVLAAWRAAERRLLSAKPGTPQFEEARAAVIREKARYLALAGAALGDDRTAATAGAPATR